MKEVIQEAVNLLEKGEACVLATVVRTRGSTPQKAGAKLLVRKDGTGVGTLGGGCVEGDIWFAAKEIMRFQGGPEFKDYFLNEEIAARDGLVCGGSMYFFLDPLWENTDFLPFAKEALKAYDGGPIVGMATVVRSPNADLLGARFMLREDDSTQGSLGDPQVEELALDAIRQVSSLGKNDTVLTSDGTELFVEGFTTPPTLVLMGGGHIGKATSTLAATLGFRTYVVDDRPEFANPDRFPEAAGTIIAPYSEGLGPSAHQRQHLHCGCHPGPSPGRLRPGSGNRHTRHLRRPLGLEAENPAHLQGLARKRPLARSAAKCPISHGTRHRCADA